MRSSDVHLAKNPAWNLRCNWRGSPQRLRFLGLGLLFVVVLWTLASMDLVVKLIASVSRRARHRSKQARQCFATAGAADAIRTPPQSPGRIAVGFSLPSAGNSFAKEAPLRNPRHRSSLARDATTRVDTFFQSAPSPSRGEVIRIHRPFAMGARKTPRTASALRGILNCTDFSKSLPVSAGKCLDMLTPRGAEHVPSSLPQMLSRAPKVLPKNFQCENSSLIVIPLHGRDENVCHLLMKMLLGFTVYRRALHSPDWLRIPPVRNVVVVGRPGERKLFASSRGRRKSMHAGLLHWMFSNHDVAVAVQGSVPEFCNARRCFAAGVFVGSHANRFSFSDADLSNNSELAPPLSSDGLALRAHIFKGRVMPKMRKKLLYVVRPRGRRRSWTRGGERSFRSLLRTVAARHGVELVIFQGRRSMGFWQQVNYFSDAAVVIGFHGAGLALCVFCPRGAALIEIEPEYHSLSLFVNLRSSGLAYEQLHLSKGSSRGSQHTSNLTPQDRDQIELTLERTIEKVKDLMLYSK